MDYIILLLYTITLTSLKVKSCLYGYLLVFLGYLLHLKTKTKKPNYDAVSSIVLFYGIVLCMSKGQPLNRLWSLYRYAIKTGFIVIQNDLRTSLIGKSKFTTQNYFKKWNFDLLIYENFLEDE